MARQTSDTIITGTSGSLVFYKMYDKGYVRSKSSLTGKAFKTRACFANSRRSAERFKTANSLASEVYRNIPEATRKYPLFCILKTTAIQLLKSGLSPQDVKLHLKTLAVPQPLYTDQQR